MSKSLVTLQKISKVAKIICKVVFILTIIGAVGCLIGCVAIVAVGPFAEIMGETMASDMQIGVLGCLTGLISCIGSAIFFRMAERYLDHELEAGTPFTEEGAKEMRRLGIASLIISASSAVFSGIVAAILTIIQSGWNDMDVSVSWSIETGLILLVLSVIFQYGADLRSQNEAPRVEWTPLWETPATEETPKEAPQENVSAGEAATEETPKEAPQEHVPSDEAATEETVAKEAAPADAATADDKGQASTQSFDVI